MNERYHGLLIAGLVCVLGLAGCASGDKPSEGDEPVDPHIVDTPSNLEEDRSYISPPDLAPRIYACASSVVVSNFIAGAVIDVFLVGRVDPIGSLESYVVGGQNINVSIEFAENDEVFATQTFNGATSDPSNTVTVTSHTADYPTGLPAPRLWERNVFNCGRAIGVGDAVPGARVTVRTEEPDGAGGFLAPVAIGGVSDFPYVITSSQFQTDWRVFADQKLCLDSSGPSGRETVIAEPTTLSGPVVEPVHEGIEIVIVAGPESGGTPEELGAGATLDVFADDQPPGSERVGGQATPGYRRQQVRINPPAGASANFTASQTLCSTTGTSSTPTPVIPCRDLPAPIIRPPLPGDTRVEILDSVIGSEILVFANGVEIGHSGGGGTHVNLSRPIASGEIIVVIQRIKTCTSGTAYEVRVDCAENTGGDAQACRGDWPAFGQSGLRARSQRVTSAIADPAKVKTLKVVHQFTAPDAAPRGFRASPIVYAGTVYIGSSGGFLYALDATDLSYKWHYPNSSGVPGLPPDASDALVGRFLSNPSSYGIASSAAIGRVENEVDAIIFGAPDQSIGTNLGSGRLFALNQSGVEVWLSPEIARQRCAPGETGVNCLTARDNNELHEQIGYSSPLVLRNRVYIGVADHGDNPIQQGRLVSVDLDLGTIDGAFNFEGSSTRGGGVWTSAAGGLRGDGVYITTGNTNCALNGGFPECSTEPPNNHGLSFLRLNRSSGAIDWKLQPVPFDLDGDPDWASGASLARTACGDIAVSTMKDGWTYAVNAAAAGGSASVRWQFPPVSIPFPDDTYDHGDSRYLFPGAVWNDVFFTTTGGYGVLSDVNAGFNRIHALNLCAGSADPVRWVAEVPGVSASGYALGPVSVTHGIVFVGTRGGRLVAFADPSVWPTAKSVCSNPDFDVADCTANGYTVKAAPELLLDIDLDSASSLGVLGEPVIADGRVYIATQSFGSGGTLYMLEPEE